MPAARLKRYYDASHAGYYEGALSRAGHARRAENSAHAEGAYTPRRQDIAGD